jgi:hypothetical protein
LPIALAKRPPDILLHHLIFELVLKLHIVSHEDKPLFCFAPPKSPLRLRAFFASNAGSTEKPAIVHQKHWHYLTEGDLAQSPVMDTVPETIERMARLILCRQINFPAPMRIPSIEFAMAPIIPAKI